MMAVEISDGDDGVRSCPDIDQAARDREGHRQLRDRAASLAK
jgi:hypothetical protein